MDISIIIVNYNVKHFLEQCLYSVFKALKNIEGEVFVVDNDSVDGSCQMVKEKFSQAQLIENKENVGFSRANNQAMKLSKGRYFLLLNPDTFLQEDTLSKCIDFCDERPDAGGLGVKMIDGKGDFLPESKRSLPTPSVAFYKIFGLSSIFPKSKIFGKYHLGYLDKEKTHKVDVLAGAFMLLRKSVLDKIGYLDETFFMYGEDIDLSYRITLAGYNNYYFPETPIIHYKGESTKKGSINYVMVFYNAMIIFARKHFTHKNARIYSLLIHLAIYFRAALGIVRRIVLTILEPVLDFLFVFLGFFFLIPYWEMYKYGDKHYYPTQFFIYIIPGYILIWMFFVYFAGGYDKKIKPLELVKGVLWGTGFIILIYSLLPETLRYSRALILFGSIWTLLSVFLSRVLGSFLFSENRKLVFRTTNKRITTVGSQKESERVLRILRESSSNFNYIGRVSVEQNEKGSQLLGNVKQLKDIIKINKIDELIFCSQDIAAGSIIESMLKTSDPSTEFKIAPPESVSVIGSNSIHTTGDLYVVDLNSLSKGVNKRKKRLFDIMSGFFLLMLSPLLMWFVQSPMGFLRNVLYVIAGSLSWVGISFDGHIETDNKDIKEGVLNPIDGLQRKNISDSLKERMSVMYAKDYKVLNDLTIMLTGFRFLGRSKKQS